ncbi:MAG: hypothetical protein ABH815_03675 [Candidatus Omnitrophota bacterium]
MLGNKPLAMIRRGYFFVQIMIKFKKDYNFKFVSILIAMLFLLNSTAYGIDLSNKTHLRKHLDFNNDRGVISRYFWVLLGAAYQEILKDKTDISPQQFLESLRSNPELSKLVQDENLQVIEDVDGNVWIYHEETNSYVIYKDGLFWPKEETEFRKVQVKDERHAVATGGAMGRWKYDRSTFDPQTGQLILHNATRIKNKDGVIEDEFLIKGENKPRDIILQTRELSQSEAEMITQYQEELGIDKVPFRIIIRDEVAIRHRIYGIAANGYGFLREDIITEGNADQIKEVVDHETRELTTAMHHDDIRTEQFQGDLNLRSLITRLSRKDKEDVRLSQMRSEGKEPLAAEKPLAATASILTNLEEARAHLAAQVEAGAITAEEQMVQDEYLQKVKDLLLGMGHIFERCPRYQLNYLSFVAEKWSMLLHQYADATEKIYSHTRSEAYLAYAELVLLEFNAAIYIASQAWSSVEEYTEYFNGRPHFVRVYKIDKFIPEWVIEYGPNQDGFVSRVYFNPYGWEDIDVMLRAYQSARLTGPAIVAFQHKLEELGIEPERGYHHFICAIEAPLFLPGKDAGLWYKRFNENATRMAITQLGLVASSERVFAEYTRNIESWIRHLIHELGHRAEVYYNVQSKIPEWYQEGCHNAKFWSGAYDWLFLRDLILGEPIVRLDRMAGFPGGPAYPHATLFCDFVDDVTDGRLAKGWVEIERRVGREGLSFEQAFEAVIGHPLHELMNQFYDQLIPLAIQSVDRVVELEYERDAITEATGIDVSGMSVEEIRDLLRGSLQLINAVLFDGNEVVDNLGSFSDAYKARRRDEIYIVVARSEEEMGQIEAELGIIGLNPQSDYLRVVVLGVPALKDYNAMLSAIETGEIFENFRVIRGRDIGKSRKHLREGALQI